MQKGLVWTSGAAAALIALVALAGSASAAELTNPTGGEYLKGVVAVTWDRADDEDTYIELKMYASGAELHPALCENCPGETFALDTTRYADGREYSLELKESAGIGTGQRVRTTTSGTFTIDNTAPVTQFVLEGADGANGWYLGDVTVTLTASDETAGVHRTLVSVDGGAFETYTGAVRVTGDGAHTVAFHSVDRAGNVEAVREVAFDIDTVAPTTGFVVGEPSVAAGHVTFVTSATPIALSAADATSGVDRLEYRVNDGAFQAYDGAFTLEGEDGAYVVEWRAVDAAGNEDATGLLRLFLDDTAPDVSIARPLGGDAIVDDTVTAGTTPAGVQADDFGAGAGASVTTFRFAFAAGQVTVTADTTDAAAGVGEVAFLVDGVVRAVVTEAPFEWTWDTSAESAGEHVVTVVSTDRLGNAASDSIEVEVVPLAPEGAQATTEDEATPRLPRYFFEKLASLAEPVTEAAPDAPDAPALPEDVPGFLTGFLGGILP